MSSPELGSEQQALVDALEAEHAAVFGYGVVAAFADPARANAVAEDTAAHRARRDATIEALRAASVDPPVAAPGYTVPFPVIDAASAAQLAEQIESDTAVAWRSVVERARSEATRATAADVLTEAALRAARWRQSRGVVPSVAFPGQP
ncbi:ferritin-like domain-containing protein [Rhodococcus pyridinivorans]|uniref:ferritin-like domain-containing protein n=1 Tax=Rhodococcus pyridinivorans TaxID=103816 RepID=UPI0021642EB5|nr:ferritin-like domain-containing protein [Rhodococcus pyridinivorans]UVT25895.1 ferritin-like domain-containing protein [Rhodococcus pyridinivorans]